MDFLSSHRLLVLSRKIKSLPEKRVVLIYSCRPRPLGSVIREGQTPAGGGGESTRLSGFCGHVQCLWRLRLTGQNSSTEASRREQRNLGSNRGRVTLGVSLGEVKITQQPHPPFQRGTWRLQSTDHQRQVNTLGRSQWPLDSPGALLPLTSGFLEKLSSKRACALVS